jgi:hypothetical protein
MDRRRAFAAPLPPPQADPNRDLIHPFCQAKQAPKKDLLGFLFIVILRLILNLTQSTQEPTMCSTQLAESTHGQVLSLPGGIAVVEFLGLRLSLPRERFEHFRTFVADLSPNPDHAGCGWRKDIYLSFSQDSPIQFGLDRAEWLELQDLLDRAIVQLELAEMLAC